MRFAAIGLPLAAASAFVSASVSDRGTLPPMQAIECAIWPNFYDMSVKNDTSVAKLHSSRTILRSSSGEGYNGLIFRDAAGWAVGGYGSPTYGFEDGVDGVDALQVTLAKMIPGGNSYVHANWESSSEPIFGKLGDSQFNFIEGMYRHSDNLQNWTVNLAQEVTSSMARSNPAPETAEVDGVSWVPETYFKIRWYWISLPAAVLVLAYVFFLGTIVQTQHREVRPWKSDASMLVFADLDRSMRVGTLDSNTLDRPYGLLKAVGTTKVGLRRR